jgi:hypothetical protein
MQCRIVALGCFIPLEVEPPVPQVLEMRTDPFQSRSLNWDALQQR